MLYLENSLKINFKQFFRVETDDTKTLLVSSFQSQYKRVRKIQQTSSSSSAKIHSSCSIPDAAGNECRQLRWLVIRK